MTKLTEWQKFFLVNAVRYGDQYYVYVWDYLDERSAIALVRKGLAERKPDEAYILTAAGVIERERLERKCWWKS